ncbi:MAG TPA: PH domain-containing protein [Candidatus Limnocylindrales bacterium]|nr:PH domain-containing protein [Candidatus Limnocylindrales bacterium]
MNELDKNLLSGEQVIFETRKHWFSPVRTSLIAILILIGALALRWFAPEGQRVLGFIGSLMDLAGIVLLIAGIAWVGYNVAEFLSAHFGVTNMRVLRYEGLLRRSSSETMLSTLTDVRLDEPALGRMLGFGNLRILTASGAAGEDEFKTVARAKELRTAIQEQKAAMLTGGTATPPATPDVVVPATPPPAPANDTASSLAAIDNLRAQNLISDEEYQAKRNEILGRL